MAKEKLPADVYAPMEAGPDKRTVSGKELTDRERSRARAQAMKEYADANSDSGMMADILNTSRSAIHHLPNTEPFGKGSSTRQRQKQEAENKMQRYKNGGKVGSASKRADGCAQRGKTRGKMR